MRHSVGNFGWEASRPPFFGRTGWWAWRLFFNRGPPPSPVSPRLVDFLVIDPPCAHWLINGCWVHRLSTPKAKKKKFENSRIHARLTSAASETTWYNAKRYFVAQPFVLIHKAPPICSPTTGKTSQLGASKSIGALLVIHLSLGRPSWHDAVSRDSGDVNSRRLLLETTKKENSPHSYTVTQWLLGQARGLAGDFLLVLCTRLCTGYGLWYSVSSYW